MATITAAWEFKETQTYSTHDKSYDVHACIRFAENLEVHDMVVSLVNVDYSAPNDTTFLSFVQHARQVQDADLTKPIILNETGVIIDGRHRLAKAMLLGEKTIKTVKFDKDPIEIFTYTDN